MKLKKFFAGVLAAAMMLTVGATAAFADTGADEAATTNPNKFENGKTEFTITSPIYLYKEYQVVNGISPEETFSFDINYVGVVQDDTAHYKPNATANSKVGDSRTIHFDAIEGPNKTEADSFSVTLSELGFNNTITGTGKYLYTITENKGNTAATSYDSRTLYMLVNVAHNVDQNNKILDGYTFYITLGHKWNETAKKMEEKADNTKAFKNTYGDGNVFDLKVTKEVKGGFGDLTKNFTFNITFKDNLQTNGAANNHGAIQIKELNNATITAQGNDTQLTAKDTLEYGKTYTIKMGDNDSIVFGNLPKDVDYSVTEVLDSGDAYNITVNSETINSGVEHTGKISGSKENIDTVAYVNTNPDSPDMGVVLDNAPYIAMLAIVAIGGVALMLNKRRRDEE